MHLKFSVPLGKRYTTPLCTTNDFSTLLWLFDTTPRVGINYLPYRHPASFLPTPPQRLACHADLLWRIVTFRLKTCNAINASHHLSATSAFAKSTAVF